MPKSHSFHRLILRTISRHILSKCHKSLAQRLTLWQHLLLEMNQMFLTILLVNMGNCHQANSSSARRVLQILRRHLLRCWSTWPNQTFSQKAKSNQMTSQTTSCSHISSLLISFGPCQSQRKKRTLLMKISRCQRRTWMTLIGSCLA